MFNRRKRHKCRPLTCVDCCCETDCVVFCVQSVEHHDCTAHNSSRPSHHLIAPTALVPLLVLKGGDIALNGKSISELRSVTCHMGSHSVTCHATQVNTPCLNPSQIGWYSFYLLRRDGRLS